MAQPLRWAFEPERLENNDVPVPRNDRRGVVAIGLLTQRDLDMLGSGFRRAIPLEGAGDFDDLLARIDEAERRSVAQAGG
jgi:hypothetical protein